MHIRKNRPQFSEQAQMRILKDDNDICDAARLHQSCCLLITMAMLVALLSHCGIHRVDEHNNMAACKVNIQDSTSQFAVQQEEAR